jgi:outer membrane protein
MLKTTVTAALAAAFLAVAPQTGFAQAKVGTVDMNRIFASYYKTKDAESRINEARSAAKKELDDRMDTHKATLEEIKKLDESINKPELSKEAKEAKAKERDQKLGEFRNLEREINEFRQTREKQLQEQAVRMRNGIVEEITKIVSEKVKKENYDLVLDRSGNSLNGVPICVFANNALDFSEAIIEELNKNKPAGGSEPAAAPAAAPADAKADKKKE